MGNPEWSLHHLVHTGRPGQFLADMRNLHNLQASTLKTIRAAVSHLHDAPNGIRESDLLNSYIDTMTKQAPPLSIHRPTIEISPTLTFARSIASRPTTSIKLLQQKLFFLLAMAALLRPSDLARIPCDSCSINEAGYLTSRLQLPRKPDANGASSSLLRSFPMRPMLNYVPYSASRLFVIILVWFLALLVHTSL